MEKKMHEIHEEVYNFLMKYHDKEESFLFTFRQINRGGRLDKGYWFHGNDQYLAVSFWRGKDRISKTHRIFFQINIDGTTSIEFKHADVYRHSDFFSSKLLDEIGVIELANGYSKRFKEADYIRSLESFIKKEKLIVDEFVNSPFNRNNASEYALPAEFILTGDFKKQLKTIKKYRKLKGEKIGNSGFLKSINIKNFGPIKMLALKDIPSESRWVFLTGENGSGKTSLLKAIATGLCQNNDQEEQIVSVNIGKFKIDLEIYNWDETTSKYSIKHSDDFSDKKMLPNAFATYGPIRLITESALDAILVKKDEKAQKKTTYNLFNPIGILRDLSNDYPLFTKPKEMEEAIEIMIENLLEIIPNIAQIELNDDNQLEFYEYFDDEGIINESITFEKLPSGTRSYIALILDLLIRFQHQRPEINDPANYNGIVLIDEIDIHLHPKLQIELVKQLSETFPKIQFIVSTHSPIPILGAPEGSIFIRIHKTQKDGVLAERLESIEDELKNMLPNTILTSPLFEFQDIFPVQHSMDEKIRTEETYQEMKNRDTVKQKLKDNSSSEIDKMLKSFIQKRKNEKK